MIHINNDVCIGCGQCAADCVADNIVIENKKAKIACACFECGHCLAICPVNAISFPNYDPSEIEEYDADSFFLQPETLLKAIKFRRSIRNFKNEKVDRKTLEDIMQAGRYTATAKNNQETRFIVVQDELSALKKLVWNHIGELVEQYGSNLPEELKIYRLFYKQHQRDPRNDYLFKNAPAVLYLSSDWQLDAGLAAQNIEMMAVAKGIGVLYNGYLQRISEDNNQLKRWIGAEDTTLKACLLLGHPAVTYYRTAPRKDAHIIWR